MEIEIHDTWVKGKKGMMHFDVAIEHKKDENDNKLAVASAKKYLRSVGEKTAKITSKECKFCHTQSSEEKLKKDIEKKGYSIIPMDGCPE